MKYSIKIKRKKNIEKKPFHPFEESILRTLDKSLKDRTPTEMAKMLGIHPETAQNRLKILENQHYVFSQKVGNRKYYRINREKFVLKQ